MKRLNKIIRAKIVANAVIAAGIPERRDAIRTRRIALAEDCRLESIGGKAVEEQILKLSQSHQAVEDIFKGETISLKRVSYSAFWLHKSGNVCVSFGGLSDTLYLHGGVNYKDFEAVEKSPCSSKHLYLAADHPLCKVRTDIINETDNIDIEAHEITTQVAAYIGSFCSLEKLIREWPEVIPLLPKEDKATANFPAIVPRALNKLLKLPKD